MELLLIFSLIVSNSIFNSKNSQIFFEKKTSTEIEIWERDSEIRYSHLESYFKNDNCKKENRTKLACLNAILNILNIWNYSLDKISGEIIKSEKEYNSEAERLSDWHPEEISFNLYEKFLEIRNSIPYDMEKYVVAKGINGFLSIKNDPHSRITLQSIEYSDDASIKENVEYFTKNNNLYIKIKNFNEGVCSKLKKIIRNDLDKIIIDLKENPGGLVDESACSATIFTGRSVVVFLEYFNGNTEIVYGDSNQLYNKKIDILVDSETASAAEIFSGFLQLKGKATIIGEKTFGKGTFQKNDIFLPNTIVSYMKTEGFFSFENYFSPQMIGIDPDIEFSQNNKLDREKDIYLFPLIRNNYKEIVSKRSFTD